MGGEAAPHQDRQHVLLLKTNMGAGHGGQSGRFTALEELAEEYAFFLLQLARRTKLKGLL